MSAPKPWRPDDGGCAASSDDVVSDRLAAATSGSLLPVHVEGWQGFVDGPPLCQRTFRRWVSMWASSAAIDAIYVEGPIFKFSMAFCFLLDALLFGDLVEGEVTPIDMS